MTTPAVMLAGVRLHELSGILHVDIACPACCQLCRGNMLCIDEHLGMHYR